MKRWIVILMTILCLGLTACGKDAANIEMPPAAEPEPRLQPATEPVPVPQKAEEEPIEWHEVWEVPELGKVSLLQPAYPAGAERMTLVVENTSGGELGYGRKVSFEKLVNGKWQTVEFVDGTGFWDDMLVVMPESVGVMKLPLGLLARPLDEGEYRVTGTPLWAGEDATASGWQVNFRVDAEAPQEPDYALYIPGQPVSGVTERLPVVFINSAGQEGMVVDIPHLERKNDGGEWEEVPFREKVGFCGTPSSLPAEGRMWPEDVLMLWGVLEEGRYRLGYQVGSTFDTDGWAYGEFDVCSPDAMICGYPAAPPSAS